MDLLLIPVVNGTQLQQAFEIRRAVYIEEQNVPEELEFDGLDDEADNFLVTADGETIATYRIRYMEGYAKLERFAVLKEFRGKGVGGFMVNEALKTSREKKFKEARLDAQVIALGFYERFGFKIISDEFLDAGIVHKKMSLILSHWP